MLVKLPWTRRAEEEAPPADLPEPQQSGQSATAVSGKTPSKGRPTPKRRDAQGARRGPLPPAPLSGAEARARRKALAGPKLNREERRTANAERREQQSQSRARMMAGEEAYLLPRDKGPVRAYVRDLVDSRRSISGAFMPVAFTMIAVSVGVPQAQAYVTPAMLVLLLAMAVEGLWLGRRVNNLVRLRFPTSPEPGFGLGWYAVTRATQLRRMRVPKPRVTTKDKDAV